MNNLIKVNTENSERPTVLGRDLHEFLEVKNRYTDWIGDLLKYGFIDGVDFVLVTEKTVTNNPKNPWTTITNHQLTLSMAKEISMIQRNEKGKQARQYFIACEEQLRNQVPAPLLPQTYLEALEALVSSEKEKIALQEEIKQLNEKVEESKEKVEMLDAIAETKDLYTIAEVAKIISNETRKNIGSKTLFKILRETNALCKDNTPYQSMVDKGFMKLKINIFVDFAGKEHTTSQTLVTPKGLVKIREWLIKSDILKLK